MIQDNSVKFTQDGTASISDNETLKINHNQFKVGDTVKITPQTYTLSQAGITYTCLAAPATSPALVATDSAAVSMSINYTCKSGKTPPSPPKPDPLPSLKPIPSYLAGDATYKVVTLGFSLCNDPTLCKKN